jgi:hypothetical protein
MSAPAASAASTVSGVESPQILTAMDMFSSSDPGEGLNTT